MLQELSTKTNLAQVGEEVGLALGTQMVKTYQEANPTDVKWYMIGREIIEKILAQPRCAGIRFYNAINEIGEKTLVYVGVDEEGTPIVKYATINKNGILENQKGIVADRVSKPGGKGENTVEPEWWTIDWTFLYDRTIKVMLLSLFLIAKPQSYQGIAWIYKYWFRNFTLNIRFDISEEI